MTSPQKNHLPEIPPEFYILVEQKFAGTVSPEGQQELEECLRRSPEALQYYVSQCEIAGSLPEALHIYQERAARQEKLPAQTIAFSRYRWAAVGAIVAVILCGVAVAVFQRNFLSTDNNNSVAKTVSDAPVCRVSNVLGASFKNQRIELKTELTASEFAIDTGVVELTFGQGARVLLESPASLVIINDNSCRLLRGKAVVDVPDSAKGFVMEGPRDRIIDYGTRFAVDVAGDGERTLLGVLNGIVDLEHNNSTVRLFTNYAIERQGEQIKSVPFDRSAFLTEMPTQEFFWNLNGLPFDEIRTLRFEVTPLVKTPGDIHVIFKWMSGENGLLVKNLRLERDGVAIVSSDERRRAGRYIGYSYGNMFPINLPSDTPLPGKWELVVEGTCTRNNNIQKEGDTATSEGIFSFEKGLLTNVTPEEVVGRWEFSHDNQTYIREFKSDGTATMTVDGKLREIPPEITPQWTVKEGVVTIEFLNGGKAWIPEKMVLRDKNTLIFLSHPYRNAQRME
ncbi:MAG: FecR family protein [Puniceicoccales bacterium]|jgi:hypothetical protein|nr:FecR family protein [Puniceicoccales bacterium]